MEGLYLVQTAVNSTYMELTNLDGTGIGKLLLVTSNLKSRSQDHTQTCFVNNSGMTIPAIPNTTWSGKIKTNTGTHLME